MIVCVGSGRAGFLLQPASKSAALATRRQNFCEKLFMEWESGERGENLLGKAFRRRKALLRFLRLDQLHVESLTPQARDIVQI